MAVTAENYTFGVEDLKLATWDGDGSYTNPTDVPGIKTARIQVETTNARQEGDDRIVAVAAKAVAATVTIINGRFSFEAVNILTGQPITSSASYKKIGITNRRTPYIGMIWRSDEAEGAGDMHIFVPKLKLMEGVQFEWSYGAFTTPELTLTALLDDNIQDINGYSYLFYALQNAAVTALTLPPAQ
jgi:hypothetical protein